MIIVIDTREILPLKFTSDIECITRTLEVGDYGALIDGVLAPIRIERKSVADLFTSFQGENYERERAKIDKAASLNLRYILAIEASAIEVRKGHSYSKDGEVHESKKSGISQVRQLMTIAHKYGVEIWFCQGRYEMAFRISEYFAGFERVIKQSKKESV